MYLNSISSQNRIIVLLAEYVTQETIEHGAPSFWSLNTWALSFADYFFDQCVFIFLATSLHCLILFSSRLSKGLSSRQTKDVP